MTKDEIKKALECCTTYEYNVCEKCPYLGVGDCSDAMIEDALDLITEQEKEIEQLKAESKSAIGCIDEQAQRIELLEKENKKLKAENKMRLINLNTALDDIKQAKIDVLMRLKTMPYSILGIDIVFVEDIDKMIKELKK